MSRELDKSFEAKKVLNAVKLQTFRKSENQKIYMSGDSPGGNSPDTIKYVYRMFLL